AQSRDFTYVADVVQANLLAADAGNLAGRVVNVAAGRSAPVHALADTIGTLMGRPVRKQYRAPRQSEVRDSWADIGEARRALGYEPRVTFEEGLRLTMDALLARNNGRPAHEPARSPVQAIDDAYGAGARAR
ncbi:MAG: UDP-glucose 4-epimerase, partial [Solirubrobacteraceae bacterium]|nr:UDP-glucose 4-epimerase [Solirubrobacteraceae bacterium]